MNALCTRRRQRQTRPSLDGLEVKVVPATVSGTAHLAAEIQVEARHVDRWETRLALVKPGSGEHEMLVKKIDRTEGRIAAQEARLLARVTPPGLALVQTPTVAATGPVAIDVMPAPSSQSSTTTAGLSPLGTVFADPSVTNGATALSMTTIATSQSSTTTANSQSSLPANVSETLDVIYNAYTQNPSEFPADIPSTNGANLVVMNGSSVGIQVFDDTPGDLSTLVSNLQSAGMQITDSSAIFGTAVGMVPVSDLPAVAALADVSSISPLMQPSLK